MKRIGVDTGGTFTDAVVWDDDQGLMGSAKASSDREDPSRALRASVGKLGGPGSGDEAASYLIHGTTVATNAVLERSGARIGMLCTEGFRDVLEIARLMRTPDQVYDLRAQLPAPLVRRRDRIEIPERLDHSGAIVRELDEDAVRGAAAVLRKRGVASVGVSLLYSYVDPRHEQRVREILTEEAPDLSVSLSSDVLPEFREFERSSTTALNAYLMPVVSGYLGRLDAVVEEWGNDLRLWIMQSNGGVTSTSRAAHVPVTLLLSGPSGGVVAGRHLAEQTGVGSAITMDMGGTSFDTCVLPANEIPVTHERQVMEMPVKVPSVDILTIGAGGGSIGWVDRAGQFRVGPQSAGASPGPACYGRGGEEATVTDANLVLGVLGDGSRLGDEVELDGAAAHRVCQTLGDRLGLSALEAAWGLRRIANTAMAGAVRAISVGRGYDPRDFALIAFGGAGPMHSTDIAAEIGMSEVLVPAVPGCHSALGLAVTDVAHDYVATHIATVGEGLEERLGSTLADLEAEAGRELDDERIPPESRELFGALDMRYVGQQFSVSVPIAGGAKGWLARTVGAFHQEHHRLFGFSVQDEPVEVVNVRVHAIGRLHQGEGMRSAARARQNGSRPAAAGDRRPVSFGPSEQDRIQTDVYDREELLPGMELEGPAIVEQSDTTLVVPPGSRARCDDASTLRLEIAA